MKSETRAFVFKFFASCLIGTKILQATPTPDCRRNLEELAPPSEATPLSETWLEDKIQLIWYPKAGNRFVTHVDLGVAGVMWNATDGFYEKAPLRAVERAAATKKGFFKFSLKVTPQELKDLEKFLKTRASKRAYQTCVSGACKALHTTTGIVIPQPFSDVPTLAALYLTVMHKMGYSRIAKVEYYGKDAVQNLKSIPVGFELSMSSIELAGTAALVYLLGVQVVSASGDLIDLLVPIFTDSK